VLLRKYIIFSLFSVLEGFKKLVIMGRRALGALKILGKWAIHTTKKTLQSKIKKGYTELTPKPSGKGNQYDRCPRDRNT
jgi:hypothetical protein